MQARRSSDSRADFPADSRVDPDVAPSGDGRDARPSKSQQKRDSTALQKLGEELVGHPPERLERVPMPDGLRTAIDEARRIRDHEGRRRQMQYIGRLMRDVDPAPIRAALDAWAGASRAETALLHRLERWRERLVADDAALTAFAQEHTAALNPATLQELRTAIRGARKEHADGRPPKHYRELFRVVRTIVVGDPDAARDPDEDDR